MFRISTNDNIMDLINKNEEQNKIKSQERKELGKRLTTGKYERLAQYRREGIPYCPKCHSTSLSANQKGYGYGKGFVGAAVVGPIGAFAGGIGSKKVMIICLNCGISLNKRKDCFSY
ncbi:hypothetical protein CFB3_18800 [Clostridium folliculivorans]|uniref:LITAF domain-containing protein n=1 Tax=Clostridium folliculivorans TaxID=2886038 RepID=A0A9W6D9D6_9CLOT|nr:hypothetical protein [Clostridium folliculivorans]GKU23657.1 hypothetical protein CFOLD11_04830 [Clostridium folliculivorans]GKU29773.1 hypothetical protein CFB3_18800 [Clostridium folliculivorans]